MPKIHGASGSPFVRKVLVAMEEKGLPYENVPVMPGSPDPAFRKMSPLGKIPVYQDGDFTLPDSSCIIAYLERVHPTPALYPSDPKQFGAALFLEEYSDSKLSEAVAAVFFERFVKTRLMKQTPDEARIKKGLEELMPPVMAYLESRAPEGDGFIGGRLSVADIAIGSQFVNWAHVGESVDAKKYPLLAAHVDRLHARPSFKKLIEQDRKLFGAL
jgi:glutathione S-transferase